MLRYYTSITYIFYIPFLLFDTFINSSKFSSAVIFKLYFFQILALFISTSENFIFFSFSFIYGKSDLILTLLILYLLFFALLV